MRGSLQHLSALPHGMCDLPNPLDSFLCQGCANGSQPTDREQSSTASALLSQVAEAVSQLSAARFANLAIQRQSEQLTNAETGHNQNGKRGSSQLVSRLHSVAAITSSAVSIDTGLPERATNKYGLLPETLPRRRG